MGKQDKTSAQWEAENAELKRKLARIAGQNRDFATRLGVVAVADQEGVAATHACTPPSAGDGRLTQPVPNDPGT